MSKINTPGFSYQVAQNIWAALQQHALVGPQLREKGKTGFYFCEWHRMDPAPLLVGLVGTLDSERRRNCFAFAQEKAQRLIAHPEHFRSWQSRDEAAQHYGGAVRIDDTINSVSALPEPLDEVASWLIHKANGRIGGDEVYAMLAGNNYRENLGSSFLNQSFL